MVFQRPIRMVSLVVLTGVLTLLPSALVGAQTADDVLRYADRTPGVTAYGMGIAGTGIARLDDASALAVNPAALGWLQESVVSGAFSSLRSTSDGTYVAPGYASDRRNTLTDSGIGNLSYLFKAPTTRGSLVVGAAISSVHSFDRGTAFDGENGSNSVTDYFIPYADEFALLEDAEGLYPEFSRALSFIAYETYAIDLDQGLVDAGDPVPFLPAGTFGTVTQTGVIEDTGRMTEIALGGAVEAAPDLMVGFGMNIPVGSFERYRLIEERDDVNDNDGTNGTTDFAYLTFSEQLSTTMVGVNGRLGVSAKVHPSLFFGATIETPTLFAIEEEYGTYIETGFDNGDLFSYGDGPGQDAGSGAFDYTMRTPWKIGLGFHYQAGPAQFKADVEWMDWSQLELQSSTYDFREENLEIRNVLQSVMNVRLGAVVDFGDVQLLAGLGIHPDPRRTSAFMNEGFLPVDRDRSLTSLGLRYRFNERMTMTAGWMLEQMKDRTDLYTDISDAPYLTEDVSRQRLLVGFTFGL